MKIKLVFGLILTVCLTVFSVNLAFAQATPKTVKEKYLNVEVEKFTIRSGVEFPPENIEGLTKSVVNTLKRSNRFTQVAMTGDTVTATDATGATRKLKISGEIIKYVKGNRAVRYVVGLGLGATKIITDVKFTDVETGEVVLAQTVDGDVSWGIFGGSSDDAKNGVADEIIRIMKKSGMAGDKLKAK